MKSKSGFLMMASGMIAKEKSFSATQRATIQDLLKVTLQNNPSLRAVDMKSVKGILNGGITDQFDCCVNAPKISKMAPIPRKFPFDVRLPGYTKKVIPGRLTENRLKEK